MDKEQNEKMLMELIDYLDGLGHFSDIALYCNGHKYVSEPFECPDASPCETENGVVYYDAGECDVMEAMEYANPDRISMTFEGPFYDLLQECPCVGQELNDIGAKYGCYYDQGYSWDLSFYDE